jgi:hypothetical protein
MALASVPIKEPIVIITQKHGVINAQLSPAWSRWFAHVLERELKKIEESHESIYYFGDYTHLIDPKKDSDENASYYIPNSYQPKHRIIVSKTDDYTITANDKMVLCNAMAKPFTVTLPPAISATKRTHDIKKTDSTRNAVTIACYSDETIDDGTTAKIKTQYESITVQSNGTDWDII